MKRIQTLLGACVIALPTVALAFPQMPLVPDAGKGTHFYSQTNLVSSIKSLKARIHDKNLLNPWGLVQGSTTPFWIADNNASVSTVYGGNGALLRKLSTKRRRLSLLLSRPLAVVLPMRHHRESFLTARPPILAAMSSSFPPRMERFRDGRRPTA